jgi:hypothetical protein
VFVCDIAWHVFNAAIAASGFSFAFVAGDPVGSCPCDDWQNTCGAALRAWCVLTRCVKQNVQYLLPVLQCDAVLSMDCFATATGYPCFLSCVQQQHDDL